MQAFYSDTFVLPPDLVFYLAGADPYEGDRPGRLEFTIDGLGARDRIAASRLAPPYLAPPHVACRVTSHL